MKKWAVINLCWVGDVRAFTEQLYKMDLNRNQINLQRVGPSTSMKHGSYPVCVSWSLILADYCEKEQETDHYAPVLHWTSLETEHWDGQTERAWLFLQCHKSSKNT